MRKIIPLSIVLAMALGGSALAVAGPGDGAGFGGWHHGAHGGAGMFALNKLNLSDAQKASIKQLVQQNFASLKTQRQALRQQRQAFEALTPDSPSYQAAAASLAQAEANFTSARVTARANLQAQIYAQLSSAQKSQLASLKAQRQQRIQEWKQFRAQHASQNANGPVSGQ